MIVSSSLEKLLSADFVTKVYTNRRDFPTFLKSGARGLVNRGKKHLDHQIGKTRAVIKL